MSKQEHAKENPVIVQFFHSSCECPVEQLKRGKSRFGSGDSVFVPWVVKKGKTNSPADDGCKIVCDGHTRRLISHDGQYVDPSGKLKSAQMAFWGEWEADTYATKLPSPKSSASFHARWVHTVSLPAVVPDPKCVNTDPCVFGSSFKYCCCLQQNRANPNIMRRLPPGSLILFGSRFHREFVLDTVFVVDGPGVEYEIRNSSNLEVSTEYRKLTLDRLHGSGKHTFFRGATFGQEQGPYSFVPAKQFTNDSAVCGERFRLDVNALNSCLTGCKQKLSTNPKKKRGITTVRTDSSTILSVWHNILNQVHNTPGFVPAVHFDWPK